MLRYLLRNVKGAANSSIRRADRDDLSCGHSTGTFDCNVAAHRCRFSGIFDRLFNNTSAGGVQTPQLVRHRVPGIGSVVICARGNTSKFGRDPFMQLAMELEVVAIRMGENQKGSKR